MENAPGLINMQSWAQKYKHQMQPKARALIFYDKKGLHFLSGLREEKINTKLGPFT